MGKLLFKYSNNLNNKMKNEVKSNKSVSSLLLSFGLTWRATTLLFVFITLFNICSVIFVYLSDKKSLLIWSTALLPLIVSNVIIGFAVFSPSVKKKLKEIERSDPEVPNKAIGRKAYLSFACYGTFIGLTIMLFVLIIALNLNDYIEYILIIWFFVGGPLLSKRLWNFYSTRLK